ncbi:MAG: hypothetical protein IJP68_13270, partial [Selenomonadaceae bacterium]|nr:hypothetical protein [Selenomonadaceae bacterium]
KSIVNIAYNPEDAYAKEAKKLRNEVGWDRDWQYSIGTQSDILKHLQSDKTETKTSDWTYPGGSPWKAGKAIYISARDININGLIQAGYSDFAVNITQADLDNATETTFFNDTLMYKVNDGGEKLNSKGYYVYEPQVYYDKANNKLYVDNIDSSSGKIYLAGRISSTGNGRIIANDGVSNINITNTSSADMSVGKVTSNEGEGFIQIVDSAQDKLTEYSSGKTRTIENYSKWLVENKKGKLTESKVTEDKGLSIGQFVEYKPKSGLTYNWTEGAEQHERVDYKYLVETTWWGAKGDSEYDACKKDLKKLAEVVMKYVNKKSNSSKASRVSNTKGTKFVDLGIGKFITDVSDTGNETDADVKSLGDLIGKYAYLFDQNKDSKDDTAKDVSLILIAQNVVMENGYQIDEWKGPFYSGAKFYKDWELYFYKNTGTKQIYTYSMKADHPISVGIIGQKGTPSINLANTSNKGGDLYLSGDIRNDKGTLNISAKSGSIIQDAGVKISTDNINLSALNDIKNIDIVNHRTDDLKLNAKSTSNEGKISVNVTGGIHNNQSLKGAVVVDTLNSKYGEVQLTAQGDIKQTIDDAPINARNIKLESTDGTINLKIKSDAQSGAELSAISAAAEGDIKLTKTDNDDFLIGSIVSTSGDVELKANGKFVDALDKARDNSDTQKSELIKSWIDMGLIAGTDDYKGAYLNRLEQDRDNYKADVTGLFKEYQALLVAYQKQLDEYNSFEDKSVLAVYQGVTDPAKVKAPEKSERLVLLEKKFGKYNSADAYLAADKDYQTLVATVANPQYQWTEEELLSSIRSSIVNKQTGASDDVTKLKDAN